MRPDPWVTLRNRFWKKVQIEKPDECWPWKGHINNCGYGRIRMGRTGRVLYAHRVAVLMDNRGIPEGMVVHHACNNRVCVNPGHLEVVTLSENNRAENRVGEYEKRYGNPGKQLDILEDASE